MRNPAHAARSGGLVRRGFHLSAAILVGAALATLTGCSPDENVGWGMTTGTATNRGGWPYWPVRLRLHPLSRLVVGEDGLILVEARVEFFERDDHTTRAYGQLRLEVHDATGPRLVGGERSWNVDLTDLEQNSARFDDVIRTYLFRLATDWTELPVAPTLHAWFVSGDGTQMQATLPLRTR